jgi:hypothetical protein
VEQFKRGRNLPVALPVQAQAFLTEITNKDQVLAELDMRQSLLLSIEQFFATDTNYLKPLPVASEIISGELAVVVKNYNELAIIMETLKIDTKREVLGKAAIDYVKSNTGATQAILDYIRSN